MIELTVGHQPDLEEGQEPKKTAASKEGKDVPKNKLMNFLALKSSGFRLVHAHYVSVVGDEDMAPATQQALRGTEGFNDVLLSDVVQEGIKALVSEQHENRVPATAVRRWHDALIKVIEDAGVEFAAKLK